MISGASDEELELANARMDIMLATNYTPDNPGPLAIIDKYNDKEIDRLNNIINELEKYIKENSIYYNTSDGCQWVDQFKVLDKLKELKEDNK